MKRSSTCDLRLDPMFLTPPRIIGLTLLLIALIVGIRAFGPSLLIGDADRMQAVERALDSAERQQRSHYRRFGSFTSGSVAVESSSLLASEPNRGPRSFALIRSMGLTLDGTVIAHSDADGQLVSITARYDDVVVERKVRADRAMRFASWPAAAQRRVRLAARAQRIYVRRYGEITKRRFDLYVISPALRRAMRNGGRLSVVANTPRDHVVMRVRYPAHQWGSRDSRARASTTVAVRPR